MGWFTRKIAATIFADPPQSSYEEVHCINSSVVYCACIYQSICVQYTNVHGPVSYSATPASLGMVSISTAPCDCY